MQAQDVSNCESSLGKKDCGEPGPGTNMLGGGESEALTHVGVGEVWDPGILRGGGLGPHTEVGPGTLAHCRDSLKGSKAPSKAPLR